MSNYRIVKVAERCIGESYPEFYLLVQSEGIQTTCGWVDEERFEYSLAGFLKAKHYIAAANTPYEVITKWDLI